MRSDGTYTRPLVQAAFGYYNPPRYGQRYDAAWSPDGNRIAFVRGFAKHQAYGGPVQPRSAIFLINAHGTGLHRLTRVRHKVETMNPVWAPDGRRIVFDEHSYVTIATTDRTYVMHSDGTDVRRLRQLESADWFWLPNGRIAYGDWNVRYRSIDPDGTGRRQAVPGRVRLGRYLWVASGRSPGSWPVSPDGNWITIAIGPRSLSIEHLDGTHQHRVTRKICCFTWEFGVGWAGR
jgi:hypothetical protein